MTTVAMNRFAKDVAAYSTKLHLIVVCLVAVPVLIGIAWIVFPFLEERNLGYPVWHFSCLLGFIMAGAGIVCWIAERLSGARSPSWIALLILAAFGFGAIALRFYGDFYWAFDRGYFLD